MMGCRESTSYTRLAALAKVIVSLSLSLSRPSPPSSPVAPRRANRELIYLALGGFIRPWLQCRRLMDAMWKEWRGGDGPWMDPLGSLLNGPRVEGYRMGRGRSLALCCATL